jgi:hypothetical protein
VSSIQQAKTVTEVKSSQKDKERHYFRQFQRAYMMPKGVVIDDDSQEKPDVIIAGIRKLGIEITHFYLQSGSLVESEQRQTRYRTEVVAEAQKLYRTAGGRNIELTFDFYKDKPITPDRKRKLPAELVTFVRSLNTMEGGEVYRHIYQDKMPEVSFIWVNTKEYSDAKWRLVSAYSVGLMSVDSLEAIVRGKESKANEYEPCDALWLLVIVEPMDPAQEQEIRVDDLHVHSDVFERIVIYKPLFEHIIDIRWPWWRQCPSYMRAAIRRFGRF